MRAIDPTRARTAAMLMAVHSTVLVAAFFALAATFEFPGVLREPPLRILELFRASQSIIQPTYYVFTLTGVTFIAMAVAAREALGDAGSGWSRFAMVAGILAGLTQAFGFIRWVWFVPAMASIATDPAASLASRDAALVMLEGMHAFAGVSVGENLSFLFQGLWTASFALALANHGSFDPLLARVGVASGATFVVYTLEQFGGAFAWLGELNVLFHLVWLTWLVLVAVLLLRAGRTDSTEELRVGPRLAAIAVSGAALLFVITRVGL